MVRLAGQPTVRRRTPPLLQLTSALRASLAPVEPAVRVVLAAVDEDAGAFDLALGDAIQGDAASAVGVPAAMGIRTLDFLKTNLNRRSMGMSNPMRHV